MRLRYKEHKGKEMEIKLIVTDLDGTLLTKKDEVHPDNIRALRRCQQRGIKVCPVTARNWKEIAPVLEQVAFDEVAALNNGACMVNLATGAVEHQLVFSKENVQGMVETICRLPYTFLSLMGTDYMHVLETSGKISWFSNYDDQERKQMGIRAFSDAGMLVRESVDVQRLTCGIQKQGETSARKALRDMQAQYGCRMMFMEEADGDYIEISPVQANKAFAMQQICCHFGIDAQHVLAFGDNENDMDMLRHAGVSVAMGNANREVQQVATMVTSSNKEGGVAAALQSLIF